MWSISRIIAFHCDNVFLLLLQSGIDSKTKKQLFYNVRFNITLSQPNSNVALTFLVSWVVTVELDAGSTDMQLKNAVKLSNVIGLITWHANRYSEVLCFIKVIMSKIIHFLLLNSPFIFMFQISLYSSVPFMDEVWRDKNKYATTVFHT